jgi:hypothetical protein
VLALECTACGARGYDYSGGVQVFGGPLKQAFMRPSVERTRATFAIVMLVLSALGFLVTNSGWTMAAFGVQVSLTTWALHEWWLAQKRHKRA